MFWRSQGFRPSVKDNPDLWSVVRGRIGPENPDPVVLIGSSRTQVGLNPRVLSRHLENTQVLQLAIDGSSPLPVLRDLAADPSFRGTVICEVAPTMFFAASPDTEAKPNEWLRRYHNRSFVVAVEAPMRAAFERRFATFLINLGPKHVLDEMLQGRLPQPHYVHMQPDRLKAARFEGMDTARALDKWERRFTEMGRVPTREELDRRFEQIDMSVRRIQERGGEVVFLHMVSSGTVREIEEQRFPRETFWEPFARSTAGIAIHYADSPTLSHFTCGDGSHLDETSAQRFSLALAEELSRVDAVANLRGVPPERSRQVRGSKSNTSQP